MPPIWQFQQARLKTWFALPPTIGAFLPTNVCAYFSTDTDAKEVDYILAPDEGHGLHAQ